MLRFSVMIPIAAGAVVLGGCSSWEPVDYTPPSEIKPGPGLVTGERGAFVVERQLATSKSKASEDGIH